jgi:hypothetical protein
MLRSAKRSLAIPLVPVELVYSAAVVIGFVLLVVQDRVHPLVVYLLQLFLAA